MRADGTREVIEIKTMSPFADSPGRPGGRGFEVVPRWPTTAIPPAHMPQIQMEMFCTDTSVNNYVVASSTHGISMFRVPRDDAYIRAMLDALRNLEVNVLRRVGPAEPLHRGGDHRFFEDDARYARLRDMSIALAKRTPLWRQVLPTAVQRGPEGDSLWL